MIHFQKPPGTIYKVVPVVLLLLILIRYEWISFYANHVKRSLLDSRFLRKCDPNDAICRHCPFFQEHMYKLFDCMNQKLDDSIDIDKSDEYIDVLEKSVKKCTFNWLRKQRVVQLIKVRKTMLTITPANSHAPLTALVVGNDKDFLLERQISMNISTTRLFATNLADEKIAKDFQLSLGGTVLPENIKISGGTEGLTSDQFFNKYFSKRPVDVVFINNIVSTTFIHQLMGHGQNGLAIPVCQLNFDVIVPESLDDLRAFVKWFKEISVSIQPHRSQFIMGHTVIFDSNKHRILRAFAVNVGNPTCVTRFLQRSECRALIATEFDE